MKKTLLILCALVCGTLAFAQKDGTYTGNLHVEVSGSESDVKDSQVTVAWDTENTSQLDFTLHDFAISIGSVSLDLGDITIKQVDVSDVENGVATFSCTEDHEVELDGTVGQLVSSITVNMTGTISDDELYASMTIDVTVLLLGSYNITATFVTPGYGLNGDYLIVNAKTGNYLAGGLAWGTQAMEGGKPQFFTLEGGDGVYTLDSHQTNGGNSHYLSDGLYCDAASANWTFEAVDGGYTIYNTTAGGYLTGNGFQEALTAETTAGETAVWKLVTKDDVIASMANATVDAPVDVSALIPSCEPKRNAWGDVVSTGVWTVTGYNVTAVPANYSFGQDYNTASVCESYHSTNGFDIRQTISSLPVGYYELTAQAFYRNDGGTVIPSMYITTGTSATDTSGSFENVYLPLHSSAEGAAGNMVDAYQEFLKELYPVSLPFIVDAEGEAFTVGFESNTTGDDAMWTIFGELGLLYMGTDLPTLTAVTGTMNVDVEAAMTAAITAYNNSKTSANYIAAEQAIFDAEESLAYYEEIAVAIESKEYEEVLSTFDEAGQAAFQTDFLDAYTNRTLTNETLEEGLVAACKAQTTSGSDMSYALLNSGEWTAAQGNGPNAYSTGTETYCDPNVTAQATTGKVLYKTIEGLPAGTYTVSFYAASNLCNGITGESGDNLTVVYANDVTAGLTVGTASSITLGDSYLYTLTNVVVGSDGKLEFGIQNIASPCGNWYVCQAISLTLGALETTIEWEMTSAGWGTMILPFDADIPTDEDGEAALTLYAGSALTVDGSTITVGTSAESIEANVPYLVSGAEGTYTFTGTPVEAESLTSAMLTGTLVDMTQDDFTADGTEYVLQNHEGTDGEAGEGLAFYPITSESTGVTLSAYHCYLTLDNSTSPDGVRAFISLPGSDNEETGIVAVESETLTNDAIYDLSGRRVSKAVKGVYIQNGKKVLVK